MTEPQKQNDPDWRGRGWEAIRGGKTTDSKKIGADYTTSPVEGASMGDLPHAYNRDELQNTNLNASLEVPKRPGATLLGLAVALALVLFALFVVLMYFRSRIVSER